MNALAIMQPDELETIQRTAKLLAASGYFGASDGITGMAQVAAKIMAGREIGIGPFASVNGIHIIKGKPAIGANLMAGAVKSSGRYDYRVRELTATVCKIEYFQRNGDKWESLGISEFTYAEATKAGTQNLDKFPKNMLFARAMSNGVRFYCPDIFSGNAVYVPEELGAEVDGDGNVVDVTPTYTTTNATNGNGDAPVRSDALFDDTPPPEEVEVSPKVVLASPTQIKRMHALGVEFHGNGKAWDEARPTWVQSASMGAITSSNDLSVKECDWIIASLEKRIKDRNAKQEQAQPVAA
jgi:hypothetical protein